LVSRVAFPPGPLVQTGEIPPQPGKQEIYYPVPYASPPNLTFPDPPGSYTVLKQTPQGFEIEIHQMYRDRRPGEGAEVKSARTWRAEGVPERP
jgi:hypothetical protein